MIYDQLRNLPTYRGLSRNLDRAIDAIVPADFEAMPIGRHAIHGDEVFAIMQEYESRQPSATIWEAHRKYIDIQIVLAGRERMGIVPLDSATVDKPYSDETDNVFFRPPADDQYVRVAAGEFTIFFPHDVHAPSLAIGESMPMRKVVFKIRVV